MESTLILRQDKVLDVDETDNVNDLKKKLKSEDRQVIVTTIQKLQILITKRLKEGTPEYTKMKNLRIAFVVDECHRAVTPGTKRTIERFLEDHYGMDLQEHQDLQRIHIHKKEIYRVQQKSYMENVCINIRFKMQFMMVQF